VIRTLEEHLIFLFLIWLVKRALQVTNDRRGQIRQFQSTRDQCIGIAATVLLIRDSGDATPVGVMTDYETAFR
jgi:hypothetical protein